MNNPMTVLLVEDDSKECDLYKNYFYTREDIKLIGITNSSKEALEYVKTHMPEGILLDIELNEGEGSGLEFLDELNTLKLDFKPVIIVITNTTTPHTHLVARKNGADLIISKLKADYTPELVINNLLIYRKSISTITSSKQTNAINVETVSERSARISDRINRELDLIGISVHLKGRKYIHESLMYLLEEKNTNANTAFIHLTKKYKTGKTTIGCAIQTAIEHAWRRSSIEDLKQHYTAVVDFNIGVPRPIEFIYYYEDKIRKAI